MWDQNYYDMYYPIADTQDQFDNVAFVTGTLTTGYIIDVLHS